MPYPEEKRASSALWGSVCIVLIAGFLIGTSSGQNRTAAVIDPLLQQAVENRKKTLGEAQNYTYREHFRNVNFDSKGVEKLKFTDTYEIIFLEGAPYKKHILHNEQPLPPKEQNAETKKLADVAKARLEHKSGGVLHASFQATLPLDQLMDQFVVTSSGEDDVDGRKNLMFTAVPKNSGEDGLKQAAHEGRAYEMKLWVDQRDGVFTKIEAHVLAEGMRYEKGTIMTYQFKKVNDEAWLPVRFWFKGKVRYMMSDVPGEAEQTYFEYKKFQADTKLITQ